MQINITRFKKSTFLPVGNSTWIKESRVCSDWFGLVLHCLIDWMNPIPRMRRKLYNNKCHLVLDRTMVVHDGEAEVSGVKKQTYGKKMVDLKRHVIDLWICFTKMYIHIYICKYTIHNRCLGFNSRPNKNLRGLSCRELLTTWFLFIYQVFFEVDVSKIYTSIKILYIDDNSESPWTRQDSPYGVMKDLKQTWTNTVKLQPVALLL